MHVLDNRLLAPGAKLADGCRNHVEVASTAGDLEQVNGPMKHSCGLLDVALADMGEGQVPGAGGADRAGQHQCADAGVLREGVR